MAGSTIEVKPRGGTRRRSIVAAFAASLAIAAMTAMTAPSHAADPESEIQRLIAALGTSGCEFERNGSWHSAAQAQAHLQRKHDWARKRGLSATTETFIERAASRSSLSGKPYRVRCPGTTPVPSAQWMRDTLRGIRATPSASPSR